MRKKYWLLAILSLALYHSTYTITMSETSVRLTAIATAAATGGIVYATDAKKNPYWWALAAPLSLFVGWVTHALFRGCTPEAKFNAAQEFAMQMSDNVVACYTYDDEQELIDTMHDIYIMHDLWLVRAQQDMAALIGRIDYHLKNLNDASHARYGDHMFARVCKELVKRLTSANKNLIKAIKVVKNHPEYMQQLTLYKEMLARERELQAQQMMAYAQMQSAIAHTHAAYNNNKHDRD